MNKRIISLSLGLLLLSSQMGLLAMDPLKQQGQETQNTQPTTEQNQDLLKKLLVRYRIQNDFIQEQNDFIQNNGLGLEFFLEGLSLLPEDKKLAHIKELTDNGMSPKTVQAIKYRIGLIPFSEIESELDSLSNRDFLPVIGLALKNGEIDEKKAQNLNDNFFWLHASTDYKLHYYGNKALRIGTLALPVTVAVIKLYNTPQATRSFTAFIKAISWCSLRVWTGF